MNHPELARRAWSCPYGQDHAPTVAGFCRRVLTQLRATTSSQRTLAPHRGPADGRIRVVAPVGLPGPAGPTAFLWTHDRAQKVPLVAGIASEVVADARLLEVESALSESQHPRKLGAFGS